MTLSKELQAKIRRYYYVEQWRVGTMARQFGVHHAAIKRVLADSGVPKPELFPRPSMIDPYLPFIQHTLEQYPNLSATRLYHMVQERGYPGSSSHFRHLMTHYRPKPTPEAYLRLKTLPGEQAQVDWGHFGHLTIGKAKRPLMAFVMVLSYSRKIFLRFYLNQRLANFLRGHVAAFTAWGGIPKVCLYDNLRSAVLERHGDAIRFHPDFLDFSAYYRFEPRPVAVARGNEKGRVERAIRFIRTAFFAGRTFNSLEQLNQQAQHWCETTASFRPCPEDKSQSVADVFQQEQPYLLAVPDNPYPTDEQLAVSVGKTPYVRFDFNDYSVPHQFVRQTLSLSASLNEVTISEHNTVIAKHPRSYDKAQQIENPEHIQALVDHKKKARLHRGQDRLTHAVPSAIELLKQAAKRGYPMASITNNLINLLDEYGPLEFESALKEALDKDSPHPNTIRACLQQRRLNTHQPPPTRLILSQDPRIKNQVIRTHSLESYEQLTNTQQEHNDD